jgi:ABC-type glycerol-3-phosphate transport system permease component
MVDLPQTERVETAPLERQIVDDAGTMRRDLIIRNVILHGILIVTALISMVPFYWMVSTSTMDLGETIQRRWVPEITYREDFATVGIVASSEGIGPGVYIFPEVQESSLEDNYEEQPADAVGYGIPVHVNYVTAWQEARFGKYFMNSVIITGVTILGLLLTCIPAAYAFARINFLGRNLIFTLLLATLMIPESVTMIPNFLVARGDIVPLPLITASAPWVASDTPWFLVQIGDNWASGARALETGGLFGWIQITAVSWLNRLPALTVPFMANAFSIFLLRQFFAKVPDELWDAARMDGCGHSRFMVQIAVPIVRPAIITVVLLSFINAWNAFLWPLLVTTRDTWRPLMVGLWTFVSEAGAETHLLMAGAVITILPMLILYFFTQKTFTEGIATSGLKG